MKSVDNWEQTKRNFTKWWNGESIGRPLMRIVTKNKTIKEPLLPEETSDNFEDFHLNVDKKVIKLRNYINTHHFKAEAFPMIDLNIGPGSLAVYIGGEPVFGEDTIWYKEVVTDWKRWGAIEFNPNNSWWKRHVDIITKAQDLSRGDFIVTIPDLIENVDILSAIRGPQPFCFDLMDEPYLIKEYLNQVDNIYFNYYNILYDIVKDNQGGSSYTAFNIWGPGKTGKVQCDFSAMISPNQFREFVLPSLKKQCKQLDYSLYHLDGPDAIRHLDAIMEIKDLNALQWTPGAGKVDGANPEWYPIYDKVKAAGKSLWVMIYDGTIDDWIESTKRMVDRYGHEGLYILYPEMEEEEADRLLSLY